MNGTNFLLEGVVVDTSDPQQMGRIKIWAPAIDGDSYKIENLPWATYTSQLAGQTRDYPAGPDSTKTGGLLSYGFWAVPKTGSLVIVGCLYGDTNKRIYISSYHRDSGNRSLPVGRNRPDLGLTPISDTLDPVEPQNTNLGVQFAGKLSASEARTRGAYERSVAQDKTDKDGTEGYQLDLVDPKDGNNKPLFDPQTYSLTTPGRHALIFQDSPTNGRARLKTAAGNQIILDDANERIYVSTAKGNSWIELDQDGHVHCYGAASMSFSTGGDFNISAAGAFNVSAADVNIGSAGSTNISACTGLNLSGEAVNFEATSAFNILSAGALVLSGSKIDLNGPTAGGADCPAAPTIIPNHEPWVRPISKNKRGPNWKA